MHGPVTSDKGVSFRVLRGPAAAWPCGFRVHGPPNLVHVQKYSFKGFVAAPQLGCPVGLGCTASGTSYKGTSFRVSRSLAARQPRGFRVHAHRDLVQRYFL